MFLLLRLQRQTSRLASLICSRSMVISTQHDYSAQIDFDMYEFKSFLFSHALRYHYVFGIKMKEKKMPLIFKHIV